MTGAPWTLAIDFGATESVAVIAAGGRTEFVEPDGTRATPTAVFLQATGILTAGAAARDQSTVAPHRYEAHPWRRLAEPAIELGDSSLPPADLVAAVFSQLYAEACRHKGWRPSLVRLTHPGRWQSDGPELAAMAAAAQQVGLPNPTFMLRPVAAAAYVCDRYDIEVGQRLALCQLDDDFVECAVLERTLGGFVIESFGAAPRPDGVKAAASVSAAEMSSALYRARLTQHQVMGVYLLGEPGVIREVARAMHASIGVYAHEVADAETAVALGGCLGAMAVRAPLAAANAGPLALRYDRMHRRQDEHRPDPYWNDNSSEFAFVIFGTIVLLMILAQIFE